jgi:hypothetical protein
MKKMLSVLLAAAALAGVGVAQAQDGGAECQASGRCGNVGRDKGLDANGNYDPRIAQDNAMRGSIRPTTATTPTEVYGLPSIIADGRWGQNYGYASPYPRTDRDRDGDGVRNNRDRYPDDPVSVTGNEKAPRGGALLGPQKKALRGD